MLTGFEHANLDGLLDRGTNAWLRADQGPDPDPADPGEPDPLVADRSACVISHNYVPNTRHFKVDTRSTSTRGFAIRMTQDSSPCR